VQVLDKDFTLPIGKAKVMRQGKDVTVTAFSKMVGLTLDAAAELEKEGIDVEVRNGSAGQEPGIGGVQQGVWLVRLAVRRGRARGRTGASAQAAAANTCVCMRAASPDIMPRLTRSGTDLQSDVSLSVLLADVVMCLCPGDQPAQHQASGP
jgi:hypothetical protein